MDDYCLLADRATKFSRHNRSVCVSNGVRITLSGLREYSVCIYSVCQCICIFAFLFSDGTYLNDALDYFEVLHRDHIIHHIPPHTSQPFTTRETIHLYFRAFNRFLQTHVLNASSIKYLLLG